MSVTQPSVNLMLQIRLLGDFGLTYQGTPLTTFNTPRLQSLLAYLVLHRHTPRSRARIAFQFWLDTPESHARANLRALVHRLRHNLPDVERFLDVTDQTLQWRPDAPFSLDVADFEIAVAQATSSTALQKASALYSGDLLPSCFDDWIIPIRETLRQTYLATLIQLINLLEDQADYTLAVDHAKRLLEHDALREESYRILMRLYALGGDRASALRVYQNCATTLEQELDVSPSTATQKLFERIRAGTVSSGAEAHRSRGELSAAPLPPRHNLLPPPTPLIGREKELTEISQLLTDPDCRLLTIVGPGGIGKTRLALEVAHQKLEQYRDGVYFVSLAGVDLVENVVPKLAHTLQLTLLNPDISQAEFLDKLSQDEPEKLLVLDNFEQLLPGGVDLLHAILTHAPQIKLIVTSRETLNTRWEWRFELNELSYPEFPPSNLPNKVRAWEKVEDYGAVQLFLRIAHQTRPRRPLSAQDIQDAGRICRLVAGMPLAIELAAAQVSRRSCEMIAAELERNLDTLATTMRDVPARQRSLRATFDHSWVSLSPKEQQIFNRLSVFRGGFTVTAAQAVTDASPALLISMVDKSMLRQVSPHRYTIHEVLRRFAVEKLSEIPGEAEQTLERYQNYYLAFLQKKTEALHKDQNAPETLAQINVELENLWAVWRQSLERDEAQRLSIELDRMQHGADWIRLLNGYSDFDLSEEYRQQLKTQTDELKVYHRLDIVWIDAVADYLLDFSNNLREEARQHFSVYIDLSTVAGKLVALPYCADIGVLYYRADLLSEYGYPAPPTTWAELERMATAVQAGERARGRANFWGFIWQGKNYEGLTCNALEWQVSHGGGQLIEPDGLISVNNPPALAAFERAARWVGTISPVEVTNYDDVVSLKLWDAGHAAFMRNWGSPFYRPEGSPLEKDKVGVARLPAGPKRHAATLGGEYLALPLYTQYPQEAIALVQHAVGAEAQLVRAEDLGNLPTRPELYHHPTLKAAHAHFSTIKEIISDDAVMRPSKITGKLYPQVSKAYATAVHSILTNRIDAATALANLEARLVAITGFEVGSPS